MLQLLQALLGGNGQNSHLDGIQNIFDTFFTIPELLLQCRDCCILLGLHSNHSVRNAVNGSIRQNLCYGELDYCPLNPVLFQSLAFTAQMAFGTAALVIVIDCPFAALAAFAGHETTTGPAKQLCGEQVFFRRFRSRGSFLIRFHSSLHPFKQFLIDDCRNPIRDHDLGIPVLSDVLPIFQNQADPADGEWNATSGS